MVPPPSDPRWLELVDRPDAHAWSLLAVRILMQRIALRNKMGMTDAERRRSAREIHDFFQKYERLAQADLDAIFGTRPGTRRPA